MRIEPTIPMTHLSIISTLMDFAADLGAPLEKSLHASGLPTRIVEDRTGYLPCKQFCRWVDRQAAIEGIDHFGIRAVMHSRVAGLQQAVVNELLASPTLYDGLRKFSALAYRESSQVSIWVENRPDGIRFCHRGSFPRDVPGQVEMSWWALGILVNVVRLFLGEDWLPDAIAVPAQGTGHGVAADLIGGRSMVPDSEIVWVFVPARQLATKAGSGATRETAPLGFGTSEMPPPDLLRSLTRTVEKYLPDRALRIQEAAEIAGTSVRSLQRYLSSRKLNYSKLVDGVRFDAATRLLRSGDMPITEIASELSYSDPTHFARRFRRLAGVSPTEYRKAKY